MSLLIDIRKSFGRFSMDIQLEAENEAVALLGASGSGKSMTLKCIAGVERPDSGRIVVDGETLFDSEKRINLQPQKRHVGLLFQNYALFPHMTVEQNVQAGMDRLLEPQVRRKQVGDTLEALYLTGLEKRLPSQLSGGQQQRVALARILLSRPRILMLDEPFSALDSFLRWEMEQTVVDVVSSFGGTTLLVSHNRGEAYRICSKIAVVAKGRIDSYGEREALFQAPHTSAAALLTGCKNIAQAKIIGPRTVFVPEWNLSLETGEEPPGNLEAVGLRARYFVRGGAKGNRFSCRVEKRIQSPFSLIFMVRPEGATGLIRWETTDRALSLFPGDQTELSISPGEVLCLK